MRYAYEVVCYVGNRPNGKVGTYRTRAAADDARRRERQTTRVRRIKVSQELFDTLPL